MSDGPPDGAAKARLFVALDLPEPAVAALVAWRRTVLRETDALRAVAPAALHVTLCFLGWLPEAAVAPLAGAVADGAAGLGGVPGLAFGEPLWLPRRRPRVLAVALEDRHGRLAALQQRLVERLAGGGWYQPEARPYLPHVTVARVQAGASASARRALPPAPALAFDGVAVTLYRSRLQRPAAAYEPLFVSRLA